MTHEFSAKEHKLLQLTELNSNELNSNKQPDPSPDNDIPTAIPYIENEKIANEKAPLIHDEKIPTYTIKTIFLGDTNTGKTYSLYALQNNYLDFPTSTIGVEFASLVRTVDNVRFKYNVWDTAGQEKYRSITQSFFKNAGIAVLFFDLTNYRSFQSLPRWMDDIKTYCPDNVTILLVGNKSDLVYKRQVEQLDIDYFINKYGIDYIEMSARTGKSLECILFNPAGIILDKIQNKKIPIESMPGLRVNECIEIKPERLSPSLCSRCTLM